MNSLIKASMLSLFTLLVSFSCSPTLTNSIPTLPIWNHVLSLTYGVNYCRVYSCSARLNFEAFTIHGLWPNSNDQPGQKPNRPKDTQLQYCDNSDALVGWEVNSIRNELENNWPSVAFYNRVRGHPLAFWQYEWSKHGTCTNLDKLSYFRFTLNLYYQVDPRVILQHFPPSSTVTYSVADLQNFHSATNFPQPYLSCDTSGDLLVEIMYCLDGTATSFVDCGSYYNDPTNCKPDFYLFPM